MEILGSRLSWISRLKLPVSVCQLIHSSAPAELGCRWSLHTDCVVKLDIGSKNTPYFWKSFIPVHQLQQAITLTDEVDNSEVLMRIDMVDPLIFFYYFLVMLYIFRRIRRYSILHNKIAIFFKRCFFFFVSRNQERGSIKPLCALI